jgi:hypothetical protein
LFAPWPVKPGETATLQVNLAMLYDLTLEGEYAVSVGTKIYLSAAA